MRTELEALEMCGKGSVVWASLCHGSPTSGGVVGANAKQVYEHKSTMGFEFHLVDRVTEGEGYGTVHSLHLIADSLYCFQPLFFKSLQILLLLPSVLSFLCLFLLGSSISFLTCPSQYFPVC